MLDSAMLSRSISTSRVPTLRAKASAVQDPTPPTPTTATRAARNDSYARTPCRRRKPPKRRSGSGALALASNSASGISTVTSLTSKTSLALGHRQQPIAGCLRRLGLRILLDQLFQHLAGAGVVLELQMAVAHREQGFGSPRMVGRLIGQLLESLDGWLVRTQAIVGIAQPVPRRFAVAGLRVGLQQLVQACRPRGEIGRTQVCQGLFEDALFVRRHLEGLAVHGHGLRLQLAQALFLSGL